MLFKVNNLYTLLARFLKSQQITSAYHAWQTRRSSEYVFLLHIVALFIILSA